MIKDIFRNKDFFNFVIYILLLAAVFHWTRQSDIHYSFAFGITLTTALIGKIGQYHPAIFAFLFVYRKEFSIFIFFLCAAFSYLLYILFPTPNGFINSSFNITVNEYFKEYFKVLLIGVMMGVLGRIMLLNLHASLIRVTNVDFAKIFVFISLIVFLWQSPVNENDLWLSPSYVLGCGFGFFLHYLIRPREQKERVYRKFRKRIKDSNHSASLTDQERKALSLYVNRKWNKLEKYLLQTPATTTIDFIKLSMFHATNEYAKALDLLADIKRDKNRKFTNLHHLLVAINESEKFNDLKDWQNYEVIQDELQKALTLNANCMMTNANLALYIVYNDNNKVSVAAKERAMELIWTAIQEYENNRDDSLHSLIIGMSVPVTYAYILDIYAYVLLKNGKTRFARHFLFQCLYLDPNHTSTYLHLAEYYYILCKDRMFSKKYQYWSKTANMCLYIAKFTEQRKRTKASRESLIENRANKLLKSI